ncbi:MAG: ferrous iron transporter B [Lachnospiraceae bacterium]|nr:ferrous iron transporter B [Lachnospiraceae bacterium]
MSEQNQSPEQLPAERLITVALAGNPNVGKSTIFNGLTGLRQHTGNWPGVTVASARGTFSVGGQEYLLIDLPGTYSLAANSQEEIIARDYICSGEADMTLIICDGTCLERGLHLLKQIVSLDYVKDSKTPLILCVNLCDEAKKKGIEIDFELLRDVLQIPVICCCARDAASLELIRQTVHDTAGQRISYDCLDFSPKQLAAEIVRYTRPDYRKREEFIDRIVTGPITGGLIMFLMILGVFWLTMSGANIPSSLLWNGLFWLEGQLAAWMLSLGAPGWLIHMLVYGIYRVLAWVVSVMLPPMAIFFPLFTLLEDLGYLPRVAFNMDRSFHRCKACGKQCLTTAMGFGCNAAGVIGCRIIDSPRERLIAILTNSLVPCNGRMPTLFLMITLFFLAQNSFGKGTGLLSALFMTSLILLGIAATLAASWILSHTLLRGVPSAFTLELPPYRRPQIRKVIVRSVFDRTLFVLGRAVMVAAPAGLIIWLLANTLYVGPTHGWFAFALSDTAVSATAPTTALVAPATAPTLLACITGFFDPLGRLIGLDGVILTAFLLGFPANEIVVPIILMTYLQSGILTEMSDPSALFTLLQAHGWTTTTLLCMMLFCLFHWPCSTTVLTIKKETGSLKWTAVSILLPTLIGIALCAATAGIGRLIAYL